MPGEGRTKGRKEREEECFEKEFVAEVNTDNHQIHKINIVFSLVFRVGAFGGSGKKDDERN